MITFENFTDSFQVREKVELSQNKLFYELLVPGNGSEKDQQIEQEKIKVVYKHLYTTYNSLKKVQFLKSDLTTVSYGGCRFITGCLGAYSCRGTDARQSHKSNGSQVLSLTPRCFSYQDRYVPIITNMIDKSGVRA